MNPKYSKEIEVGDAHKVHITQLSGNKPWIYAKIFYYQEMYEETPFIKELVFYSSSTIKDAKLKIRLFSVKDSLPSDDLINEDFIVTVKKGMKKNVVDLSKYKILFPKSHVAIGLEWLIIEENKYYFTYKDTKTNKEISTENYAPSLVINYTAEEHAFMYSKGRWFKNKKHQRKLSEEMKHKKQNKKYFKDMNGTVNSPAINLILSN